jgi:uncharacterized membrane protein YdbT with pleckstrin-like domain
MSEPIDPRGHPDHLARMQVYITSDGKTIEMDPNGSLQRASLMNRLVFWAVVVAVVAGAALFAALAFWLAMILIPVAVGAAIVAWALMRFRLWQAGRNLRRPGAPW